MAPPVTAPWPHSPPWIFINQVINNMPDGRCQVSLCSKRCSRSSPLRCPLSQRPGLGQNWVDGIQHSHGSIAMSEYQYYEFQAVDRPLSKREMAELRALSTRATITPTRFVNFYNWGNFRGNPAALMEEYFDAFVY